MYKHKHYYENGEPKLYRARHPKHLVGATYALDKATLGTYAAVARKHHVSESAVKSALKAYWKARAAYPDWAPERDIAKPDNQDVP